VPEVVGPLVVSVVVVVVDVGPGVVDAGGAALRVESVALVVVVSVFLLQPARTTSPASSGTEMYRSMAGLLCASRVTRRA
jgi:hypothetical protein